MPSWNDLASDLATITDPQAGAAWLRTQLVDYLKRLSTKRDGRNVIFYASSFLQKPMAPAMHLQIMAEDINGFMAALVGCDWSRNLTLILHTPGGVANAAETIVEYLTSKFRHIEVIIPTYAMSAGTMISLAADHLIMGRQSQLGPIDPQMTFNGRPVSARAIVDQFELAKEEILKDNRVAPVWAPALQSLGPSLLKEAIDALDYGQMMVAHWLYERMLAKRRRKAAKVANYFNRSRKHKSHGRRISRSEVQKQGLSVEFLEKDQELQEIVLTNYHLAMLIFEKSPAAKFIMSDTGKEWIKNLPSPAPKPN